MLPDLEHTDCCYCRCVWLLPRGGPALLSPLNWCVLRTQSGCDFLPFFPVSLEVLNPTQAWLSRSHWQFSRSKFILFRLVLCAAPCALLGTSGVRCSRSRERNTAIIWASRDLVGLWWLSHLTEMRWRWQLNQLTFPQPHGSAKLRTLSSWGLCFTYSPANTAPPPRWVWEGERSHTAPLNSFLTCVNISKVL